MASKRRGQRILSARKASQWDEDRIKHFEESQRHRHEWIKFAEIAEEYSERGGPARPKKAAAARERAYTILESDLIAGYFEERGRSRVRFVFPGVSWTHGKMTRKWLKDAIDNDWDGRRGRSYLENCWLPRTLYKRWCARHHLSTSPPRFQPTEGENPTWSSNKSGRPPTADEAAPKDQARRQPGRERARRALEALFGSRVPDAAALPNKRLAAQVNEWLEERKQPSVGQRTIQRAAGRK